MQRAALPYAPHCLIRPISLPIQFLPFPKSSSIERKAKVKRFFRKEEAASPSPAMYWVEWFSFLLIRFLPLPKSSPIDRKGKEKRFFRKEEAASPSPAMYWVEWFSFLRIRFLPLPKSSPIDRKGNVKCFFCEGEAASPSPAMSCLPKRTDNRCLPHSVLLFTFCFSLGYCMSM